MAPELQEVERRAPLRAVFWIGPLAALIGAAVALFYDADSGLRAVFHLHGELDEIVVRLPRPTAQAERPRF